MPDSRLSPRSTRLGQIVAPGFFGLLTVACALALATYPSWQLVVATLCSAVGIPLAWLAVRSMLVSFHPGVPARRYLTSMVPSLGVVAVVGAIAWMFSIAPGD